MTYHCMYKNECSHKECVYRETKSKFSTGQGGRDLTIDGFKCIMIGSKPMRLISDERIICDRYKECTVNCFLKTSYITANNFEKYFGRKFDLSKLFKCYDAKRLVKLITAGENVGSYINIWS